MGRARPFLVLGFAVVMALVTSVLVYSWLRQQAKPAVAQAEPPKTQMVALTKMDLPWGTKLEPEMVEMVAFPQASAPDGHIGALEDVTGRVLVTSLKRHEPILQTRLAPKGVTTGGVAALMSPTHRAMAVKVDEVVGVAGFVKPGDRVDVLVTISPTEKVSEAITKVVLENALVLAAGTDLERKGQDKEPAQVKVITLEVTPEESEKLALAANEGKLRLALRSPLNAEPVLTRGATIPSLLASYRVPQEAPAKTKQQKLETEVIKGGKVSRVSFHDPGQ
jgi:pilus assembly protein CpaB